MITTAIKADKANGASIIAAGSGFILIDQLHCLEFRSATKRPRRKRSSQQFKRIVPRPEFTPYLAYQVDDMGIIVHLAVLTHLHLIATTAQIIAGKVYQHDVFGI